jgi:23S rRNA (uracil1939-C5)-methyltransferase
MEEKNKVFAIKITDLNPDGNGVGRTDTGRVVFVPLAAPGDICEVKVIKEYPGYLVARLEKILEPSPDRIVPSCPVYNKCGGCSYGHITYEKEKQIKEDMVRSAFRRIAGMDVEVNPLVSVNRERYRNKVQYPVSRDDSFAFGYYARHSHRVVPHTDCLLQDSIFCEIAEKLCGIFDEKGFSAYDEASGSGLIRHIYIRRTRAGEVCVCVVVNADVLPFQKEIADRICVSFPQVKSFFININKKKSNVILGDRNVLVVGEPFITEILCGKRFSLSPSSFFQVNSDAAEKLYEKAAEYASLSEGETLLDLYCGTGTIGLCVAGEDNPLCGVEIVGEAIENARHNAVANGRREENTLFVCGDAVNGMTACEKHFGKPSVVIVDPPRKGLDKNLINDIALADRKSGLYLCNPATLARDIKSSPKTATSARSHSVRHVPPYGAC